MSGQSTFQVWQDGMMVAFTRGPAEQALQEAMHYAQQYATEGPVKIYEGAGREKVLVAWCEMSRKKP